MAYGSYQSFQLPLSKTAGRAIRTGRPIKIRDVRKEQDYRDVALVKQFGLRQMIAVPLPRSEEVKLEYGEINQKFIGVLCAYLNDEQNIDSVATTLWSVAPIIAITYQHAVIGELLTIRQDTMQTALAARDVDSFLHRLLSRLHSAWHYEALSAFLFDERSKTIRLKATTGLQNNPKKNEVQYRLDEASATVRTQTSGKSMLIMDPDKKHSNGKYKEAVAGARVAALLLPIYEPVKMEDMTQRCIGVLRIVNRILIFDSRREPICFGWEDAVFLQFVSGIIGVIAYMFGRVARKVEDFERAMHGAEGAILAVRAGLNQLMERTKIESLIDQQFIYVIPNALANLAALGWQIERFSRPEHERKLQLSKLTLAGEVLSKLQLVLQSMVRSFGDPKQGWRITNIGDRFIRDQQGGIPAVRGDVAALMTVFRNLLENAVKYSKRRSVVEVDLSWSQDKSFVYVSFSDKGIGIDDADAPYIFLESFKAEEAMRRHPVGIGLGLYQASEIMRQLGGAITLDHHRDPTTFMVKIQKWNEAAE